MPDGVPVSAAWLVLLFGQVRAWKSRSHHAIASDPLDSARLPEHVYLRINRCACLQKFLCLLLQTNLKCFFFGNFLFSGKFPNVLGDLDALRWPARLALRVTLMSSTRSTAKTEFAND
jgi:hypothetical protein